MVDDDPTPDHLIPATTDLPAADPATPHPAEPDAAAPGAIARGLPAEVLDDAVVRQRAVDVLREAGYEITEEGMAAARLRLDRSTSTAPAEIRAESRERVREIMGWS